MATKSFVGGVGDNWKDTMTADQCLSHLCLSQHLSDISFVFKGNKDVRLPAHKFVLSMRSDVFKAMFYGSLAEEGNTILIEDNEPETMKNVLRFIYSDKPELNESNVLHCLYTAKKYALTGLVNQCSSFLENNMDTSNVCLIHEQAVFYEMKPLQTKCFDYLLENASDVFSSEGFQQVSHTTLLNLLKHEELATEEVDVFNAAVKWAQSYCKTKQLPQDANNLRKCLGEVVFEIRFPIMPIETFATKVTPSGILTSEEQVMLYQFNATKGSSPVGRFSHQDRSGSTLTETIDISQHITSKQKAYKSEYVLQIQYQFDYYDGHIYPGKGKKTNYTPLKIKALTGSFVKNVETLMVGNIPAEFRIIGNKIKFKNPMNVANGDMVVFNVKKDASRVFSFYTNIHIDVNGQMIYITHVPAGMETITFAKC